MEDVEDEDAEKLVNTCPVKVFDIEDIGKGKDFWYLSVSSFSWFTQGNLVAKIFFPKIYFDC